MSNQEFTDFEVSVDVTEVDAWGGEYELIPPGDYRLRIVGFEQKTAKESGNPMIAVTYEVVDGDHQGKKVFNNYVLTQKAMGRIKQLMLAARTRLDKIVASEFMGAEIVATVIHTEGKPTINEAGETRPAKTFANVMSEQPVEQAAPVQTTKPPVTNKPTGAQKNNATGTRRA